MRAASGKRRDAPCQCDSAALRVAPGLPARSVERLDRSVATLFGLFLTARTAPMAPPTATASIKFMAKRFHSEGSMARGPDERPRRTRRGEAGKATETRGW